MCGKFIILVKLIIVKYMYVIDWMRLVFLVIRLLVIWGFMEWEFMLRCRYLL